MTKLKVTAWRVTQSLYDEVVVFDGLNFDVYSAYEIVDCIINDVIATLRRDPRFAAIPIAELELMLADVGRDAVDDVANNIAELVAVDDVRTAAERGFPIDDDGSRA